MLYSIKSKQMKRGIYVNKSYILLDLYSVLTRHGELSINSCCNEYGISISTFRRYISCLRNYFLEKEGKDIIYNALKRVYVLEELIKNT